MTVPEPLALVVGSTPTRVPKRQEFGTLIDSLRRDRQQHAASIRQAILQRRRPLRREIGIHRDHVRYLRVEVGDADGIDRAVGRDRGTQC